MESTSRNPPLARIDVERGRDIVENRAGRRFSEIDLEILLHRVSTIARPLTEKEAAELRRREAETDRHWRFLELGN